MNTKSDHAFLLDPYKPRLTVEVEIPQSRIPRRKVEIKQEQQAPETKLKSKATSTNGTTPRPQVPVNFTSTPQSVFAGPAAPPNLSTIPSAVLGGGMSLLRLTPSISPMFEYDFKNEELANFPPIAQNEDLKNIMMSWYYAGYYTGLYEGQQKAWAEMQEQQQQAEHGAMEEG